MSKHSHRFNSSHRSGLQLLPHSLLLGNHLRKLLLLRSVRQITFNFSSRTSWVYSSHQRIDNLLHIKMSSPTHTNSTNKAVTRMTRVRKAARSSTNSIIDSAIDMTPVSKTEPKKIQMISHYKYGISNAFLLYEAAFHFIRQALASALRVAAKITTAT